MGRIIVHLHGKPSQRNYAALLEDYSTRLKSKIKLEYYNSKMTPEDYLSSLPSGAILCDEGGTQYSSIEFADRISEWIISTSDIHLCIGPADGFPTGHGEEMLSLSSMTLPHELAAVVLIEQIYRSFEINRGTSYHRI